MRPISLSTVVRMAGNIAGAYIVQGITDPDEVAKLSLQVARRIVFKAFAEEQQTEQENAIGKEN